jgi:hypothetical protein
MYSEPALKSRYCAQMMAGASVLASTAPDDFRRRILARSVFVYCHEFIRWTRTAKNELKGQKDHRMKVQELTRELNTLAKRDWGPYEEIRHRIAAHRQAVTEDQSAAILHTTELWTDISDDAVRILSEDARAIWNGLAAVHDLPALVSFPPISPELQAALAERGYEPPPEGLVSGVGSFDASREDAIFMIQGGELGELNRQIVDAVRNIRTLSQLWQAVNGHDPYWQVVIGATVTEACTLVELVYEQSPTTKAKYQQLSLLELLGRDDPQSAAIPLLQTSHEALSSDALEHVRRLRNIAGAHVDDRLSLNDIIDSLRGFDPHAVNAVIDNVFAAITNAGHADLRLGLVLMQDVALGGVTLAKPPPQARPYGDALRNSLPAIPHAPG